MSAPTDADFPEYVGAGSHEDWHDIIALAARHRLTPLLYKRLNQSTVRPRAGSSRPAPNCISRADWNDLRLDFFTSAERNASLYRLLGPILAALRSHDIPVIVLKGAYLAACVYPKAALRPMGDVDLLVPRPELARARAALVETGCTHKPDTDIDSWCRISHQLSIFSIPGTLIDGKQETAGQKNSQSPLTNCQRPASYPALPSTSTCAPSLCGLRSSVTVEIHWTIESPTSPFTIPPTGLWDRARPAQIAGAGVLTLSPEDLLLHVCLHAAYHHGLGTGLVSICDIAFIVERYRTELDWPQLVRRAQEWGATRYVGLMLTLARELLGADVPDDVPGSLVPEGFAPHILETARECVLAGISYLRVKPKSTREMLGIGSFRDRLKAFRYRMASPGVIDGIRRRILRPYLSKLLNRTQDRERVLADWLSRGNTR